MYNEIKRLCKAYGIERLGFLTLTFAEHITEVREASRRFNSLNTHVLKDRYERAIAVVERQKSARLHFHLLVVLDVDIRTGANWEAFAKGDYRSANAALRAEWAFWRRTAPEYGFGRTELLPVKSNEEGIARYVGKYVAKHIGQRDAADKGARLVRYIGYGDGGRRASTRFSFRNSGSWLWRHKLGEFMRHHGFTSTEEVERLLGSRWAYKIQDLVRATELPQGIVMEAGADCIEDRRKRASEVARWRLTLPQIDEIYVRAGQRE